MNSSYFTQILLTYVIQSDYIYIFSILIMLYCNFAYKTLIKVLLIAFFLGIKSQNIDSHGRHASLKKMYQLLVLCICKEYQYFSTS